MYLAPGKSSYAYTNKYKCEGEGKNFSDIDTLHFEFRFTYFCFAFDN